MWKVDYTKKFLKELASLPPNIQSRVETIVFQELVSDNPFTLGYLEKMKGYPNKYKIRIGDYRIGITIESGMKNIICQRVAHRREIYRIFP
ncbi:MAG: type II toxin-antitoxin system RelE/ParE family toxin [Coleofasciculaceae cyanobacterium SM2_1_6]|nr:type II toxin-antitoxin system RelE/ParE family toxin [Coleofasciculaceae cyanobacterium SM2_1_6]